MRAISKDVFLNFSACPVLSWRMRRGDPPGEISVSQQYLINQGREIHMRARMLFGDGRQVTPLDMHQAAEETKRLMADAATPIIFEGAFIHGEFRARADVLVREGDGWHLYEIKSGTGEKRNTWLTLLTPMACWIDVISP